MTRNPAAELAAAVASYQAALDAYLAVLPCPSHWPSDLPGPDYLGTPCDLTEGHTLLPAEHPDHAHRHRIKGTTTDVTW